MLYWVLSFAGGLVTLVALAIILATILGRRLSPHHTVRATLRVATPIEAVFTLIDALEAQPGWDKGVTSVETLAPDGEKVRRRMRMGRNSFVLTDTTREPPALLVRTIDDEHKFFGGSWTFELSRDGEGTKVVLTEHGTITPPIPRFMMKYFVDPAMYLKRQLAAIARALGQEPRISDVQRLA